MESIEDMILKSFGNVLKRFKDTLKFDKTYYGKVVGVTGNKAYVLIDGIDYKSRIKNGIDISVGDVVIIKAPNSDMSMIYVDGRLL